MKKFHIHFAAAASLALASGFTFADDAAPGAVPGPEVETGAKTEAE